MGLDDFTITKFLGKGSYGSVYCVVRKATGQEYALKQVNIKNMGQKGREEAVNEVRILASLRCKNVITYYDAFVEKDSVYIVTEIAKGGDLLRKLKKLRAKKYMLDEDSVWVTFIQIVTGLQFLHSRNILHRDLKTANILLSGHNRIKIADLGVAKILHSSSAYARTQIGTPYYLSPELWKNRPYNAKSDIWSLGCVLYELCAMRPPFQAKSMKSLASEVLHGQYQDISSKFSKDLSQMIAKLLAKDPAKRPSAEQILRMPTVASRMHLVPGYGENVADSPSKEAKILRTIRVPKQLRLLQDRLPGPNYSPVEAKKHVPRVSHESPLNPKYSSDRKTPVRSAGSASDKERTPPLPAKDPHRAAAAAKARLPLRENYQRRAKEQALARLRPRGGGAGPIGEGPAADRAYQAVYLGDRGSRARRQRDQPPTAKQGGRYNLRSQAYNVLQGPTAHYALPSRRRYY